MSASGSILADNHRKELRDGSAISEEQIASRGYQTVLNKRSLPQQFTGAQRELDGLLIPIWNTRGEIAAYQLKPREPRTIEGRIAKYEFAKACSVCLDVPSAALPYLKDIEADLWITEGAKKVDSAVSNGLPCTIGLIGVWNWRDGGKVALPDWNDIALKQRRLIIAFDSDVMIKNTVRAALDELSGFLRYRGADVRFCILPLPGYKRDRRGER